MASLQVQFEEAAAAAPKLKQSTNAEKLEFYGLYKQGKGETFNPDKKLGIMDFEGKAKQQAWGQVKDMPAEEAQQKYIELFDKMKTQYGLRE